MQENRNESVINYRERLKDFFGKKKVVAGLVNDEGSGWQEVICTHSSERLLNLPGSVCTSCRWNNYLALKKLNANEEI